MGAHPAFTHSHVFTSDIRRDVIRTDKLRRMETVKELMWILEDRVGQRLGAVKREIGRLERLAEAEDKVRMLQRRVIGRSGARTPSEERRSPRRSFALTPPPTRSVSPRSVRV